jgi:hypothetical protein
MDANSGKERLSIRRAFGGAVEITDLQSGIYLVSEVNELDGASCSVRTTASFSVGARISLKIHHNGTQFEALGTVTHVLHGHGMEVLYEPVSQADVAVVAGWLAESAGGEAS